VTTGPLPEIAVVPPAGAESRAGGGVGRELLRSKASLVGLVIVALVGLLALFAPMIAPADPSTIDLFHRLAKPVWLGGSWSHPLGTDALGHDELALLVYGARVSMVTGIVVIVLAGTFGTLLGLVAGYFRGWRELAIMRLVDASIAFPGLLLALIVLTMIGPGQRTLIIVLAAISWMVFARVTHDIVLGLRETTFVKAAETVGASRSRIIVRHLLPNLASALLTVATLEFASVVLSEASLSYLGFGIQPPGSSWGLMVANGQEYLSSAWWLVATPGFAIAVTVLALNLLAGWLRVTADPRQREKQLGELRRSRRSLRRATAAQGRIGPIVTVEAAASPNDPILEVRNLRVEFGSSSGAVAHAVRDVSLSVRRGETLALVGESGSGKSITARSILGLVVPPGKVVDGEISWRLPDRGPGSLDERRIVGNRATMVFQDPVASLNPLLTIGRQIGEVLRAHKGMTGAEADARAIELLDLVGIPSPERRLRQYPYQLSGGMAQRVMIATALAPEPDLIIADEPTTALDVTIQAQVLELLADVQRRFGMALILIAHDLGVVAGTCDRVAVVYAGRVVEEGSADEIFARPRHPYTAGLIGCTPRLDRPRRGRMLSIVGSAPVPTAQIEGCAFAPRCSRRSERCVTELPRLVADNGGDRYACWHPLPAPLESAQGA
jgi:oligopeptide/dipeptide ABC transporter ATP-binding protein